MTDREMLEMAAKAAGYRLEWHIPKAGSDEPHIEGMDWNPLTDDGDALRLAVKLRMSVFHSLSDVYVVDDDGDIEVEEGHKRDPLAATRRAIVRTATEIGRQMP